MSTLEWTFIAIGGFGAVILLLSAIGGGLGSDFDVSADADADASPGHGFEGPSWHSFTVLAGGLAGLGLGGFAATHYNLPALFCWLIAVAGGALFWALILFGIVKPLARNQHNDVLQTDSLIGCESRVIIPVPADGIGQIDLSGPNGSYHRFTARLFDNTSIPTGSEVLIVEIVDGIAHVKQYTTPTELEL